MRLRANYCTGAINCVCSFEQELVDADTCLKSHATSGLTEKQFSTFEYGTVSKTRPKTIREENG